MKRALITGSTGRLGSAFVSLWKKHPGFSVSTLTREDADLTQPDELRKKLQSRDFDILINPAAMSGLEECLDHPDQAHAINVLAPEIMAQACREKDARFVHFSTDYVFSGDQNHPLTEHDTPCPKNTYGKTKLSGEHAVLATFPKALVARVSWLFGPSPAHRPTHFDNSINRALSEEPAPFIDDKFSIPTYTHDVVAWTEALLEKPNTQGIFHLCNTGTPESWLSYAIQACQIAEQNGLNLPPRQFTPISLKDATFFREIRPAHTTMKPHRLITELGITPRAWTDAAAEYVKIR